MTTNETRRYEMLVRVSGFGEARQDLFPAASLAGQAFQAVSAAVQQLAAHAVSKARTAKGGKKATAVARQALLARLEAIDRSARGIAVKYGGFADAFALPRARTDAALLTAGRTFIEEAEHVKEQFTRYDMPEDFIGQLAGCVEAFAEATKTQQTVRDKREEARASIEETFAAAFAALQTLDTSVPNRLSKDPVTMAVWEQNRRVDWSRRTRRVTSVAPAAVVDVPTVVPSAASDETPASALEKAS